MPMVITISRILLGVIFLVFGLNAFFSFIPLPSIPGDGGIFLGILFKSGFLSVVKIIEVISGVLLVINFHARFGLALITPVVVSIALFHLCIVKDGFFPLPFVTVVLCAVLIISYWNDITAAFKR